MSDKSLPANQGTPEAAEPDASKAVDMTSSAQADTATSKEPAKSNEAAAAIDSAKDSATSSAGATAEDHVADTPPDAALAENGHDSQASKIAATPEAPTSNEAPSTGRSWWWPRWPDDKEARLKLVLGGLAALLALQWWNARSDISDLKREVAQRLQSGENLNSQTKLIADRVDDQLRVLQGKVSVLEARQSDAQNQQAALEQLYRDLAKNRDDWALAEIEQVLSTASQQLQLAGNVRSALVALQSADARLSRVDRPQFIAIRRAIAQDIEKLKSLPSVDLTGVAVRLDSLVAQVDAMPLLSDEKPGIVAPSPKTKLSNRQKVESNSAFDWRVEMQERWTAWSSELWNDLKQLMRIRTVTAPEALLLTPEQAFFARENVKLRLLNARVALLSRNDAAFRSDLAEADRALQRYFDLRDPHTRAGRELIRQIRESVLNIEMPTLSHSLAAVRQSRSRP
jgi:uroporphyrin-3 C-methyltransferase/uroporphyrinogen III methyltransferase/synthase